MELYCVAEDFITQRIDIVCSRAGIKLSKLVVSHEEVLSISGNLSSAICLKTPKDGTLFRSGGILRYLGRLHADAQLFGCNLHEETLVDQWMEYATNAVDVPVAIVTGASKITVSPASTANALECVRESLISMENRLSQYTYLVGSRLSLADINLFTAVNSISSHHPTLLDGSVSVKRWLSSCVTEFATSQSPTTATYQSKHSPKFSRSRIRIKELLDSYLSYINADVFLSGWVRTIREQSKGKLLFVELNDGSCSRSVQVVLQKGQCEGFDDVSNISGGTGSSLSVFGKLVSSQGAGQLVEVQGSKCVVLGPVYAGDEAMSTIGGKYYPLSKRAHTLEYLRSIAHLRPRTKIHSAAMRVRNSMAYATHKFFQDQGFLYIHTPILTSADCEGAGEQFVVTTLLNNTASGSTAAIDFSKDFFGSRTCLTVSGQLNVETHCCALADVYTFGPTFRAEVSHTSRHLSEFWMIEPEIAFADITDNMNLAEDYLKYCIEFAMEHNMDDLEYFESGCAEGEVGLLARLNNVLKNQFIRLTYTEGVEILQAHVREGKIQFEVTVEWGIDLGSEHERYLTEVVFGQPIILTGYPKGIKAFYMKMNDDGRTVRAMDVLVPKIGEIIGGSQREEDLGRLTARCHEMHIEPESLKWYLDLRRYGSVPHSGFGLGFERLVMFITGIENIRDVIPFPRYPGHAEF